MTAKFARVHIAEILDHSSGRLIVRGHAWALGTVTAYRLNAKGEEVQAYYADYEDHTDEDGKEVRAAIFPFLPTGNYKVCRPGFTRIGHHVTVFPAHVGEIELT